ncbi:3-ketoacyl-ACP reductase [Pseudolabrys sp. Root1462]|jgi:NAD(P)-dependent dehydrogenase (short-subunit alcohol dehydrogenase family)|uniref:3-ketoacyl-ACP reductase n=1 Tax=Pseudolabrys sp. Root1462 TaxID=1736466 RepID=UPI000702EE15|nr:3-ketoacyl-ACP reductase [Pseudolabrys sp. Root1462]KQZ00105.1 3-ketoacyl-ACP reductase [Pseudolabrys sp. Root1462]
MSERPRVFITGGRRGIGRGVAYAFAEAGYDVAINDIVRDEAAEETLAGLRQRGAGAAFIEGDIADLSGHPRLIDAAWGAFGSIECLFNNAGITSRERGDMLNLTPDSYDAVMGINLRGPFFLTQNVARRMVAAAAGPHPRSIINISSANATLVAPDRADYCLSKTAISMMTKLYAVRLAEAGIGVFEIRPGIIRTDMTAVVREKYDRLIGEGVVPAKRWGEPADIGKAAVTLASGSLHYSSGDAIHVDGGLHIHRL